MPREPQRWYSIRRRRVALDATGEIVVAAGTASTFAPLVSGFQTTYLGSNDAYLVRFDMSQTAPVLSNGENAASLSADPNGSISPGMIVTGATAPVLEKPGFIDTVMSKMMLKRLGQPEDVAWCATYLASDESTWVTGADISVDGGATAL